MGSFSAFVELPATQKGVNMSRFAQVLREFAEVQVVNRVTMLELAAKLKSRHESSRYAGVTIRFECVENKLAPATDNGGPIPIEVAVEAEQLEDKKAFYQSISVGVMTVCPCSLEMSGNTHAHNQRAIVELRCLAKEWIPISELSLMARKGSGDLHFVLKRPDEKAVVAEAFQNPKFVEDVVRDVSLAVDADERVEHYSVVVRSMESIHPYDCVGLVDSWE